MTRGEVGQPHLWDPQWFGYGTRTANDDYRKVFGHDTRRDWETMELLGEALDELDPAERSLINEWLFEQKSQREISEARNWTCGDPPYTDTKKAWREVHKALDALRENLSDTVEGRESEAAEKIQELLDERDE